jgi:hypothetical protein
MKKTLTVFILIFSLVLFTACDVFTNSTTEFTTIENTNPEANSEDELIPDEDDQDDSDSDNQSDISFTPSDYSFDFINIMNSIYSGNNNNGTSGYDNNTFSSNLAESKKMKVLISAPHAVRHIRLGNPKGPDTYTGSMARILAQNFDSFLVSNVYNDPNNPRDPNYDSFSNCTYTNEVVDLINTHNIKFLLDLHGAASTRPFDIAIGTNHDDTIDYNNDIKNIIYELANKYSFMLDYNETFAATNVNTITRKVHIQTGIPTIQIEINGRYRLTKGSVKDYNKMMDFLKELTISLDRII